MNEPQLSAEMEAKLEQLIKENMWGLVCPCGGGGTDENNETCKTCGGCGIYEWKTQPLISAIATALEEQRKEYRKDLEEIIGNSEVYIFPPGVETAYAMYADKKMAVKGMCINGDINILNGKTK